MIYMIHLVFKCQIGDKVYFSVREIPGSILETECHKSQFWTIEKYRVYHAVKVGEDQYVIDAVGLPFDGHIVRRQK